MFITRQQIETFLLISVGAIVGANLRYWVSLWAADALGKTFPWGTLIINFTGSALLGIFTGWLANHVNIDPRLRLLVAIGFFGAYTTFSTYANETIALLQSGNWLGAAGDILGTNLLCIIGALIGIVIGSRL